jgi:hypothetical protein
VNLNISAYNGSEKNIYKKTLWLPVN